MHASVWPEDGAPPGLSDRHRYLERVAEIAPLLERCADTIERERRLPGELLAALHGAGLFRLLLEKRFNGAELCPADFSAVIEAVARHDGSTAWCLCQASGCSMSASFLDEEVANLIWGNDSEGVLAWGPGKSTAIREDGGYRVNAKCAFASGGRHATWLGTHATIVDEAGEPERDEAGEPTIRTMLIPAPKIVWEDIWHVIGLRGTASDGYLVENLFVPGENTLHRDDPAERRTSNPLYLFRQTNLYACGFAGVALGLAGAMVDAFADLAREKIPRRRRTTLSHNAVVQSDFAKASVRLAAARTFLASELDDIWRNVVAEGALGIPQRMRIRLATTHAIHEAKAAADLVYEAAGATAIFASGPYERRFRDLHTVTQQAQGQKAHYETVGSFMLGNPPELSAL